MFYLMFVHYTLSLVWIAKWPPIGKKLPTRWPFVLIVFCLYVIHVFIYFPF